MADVDVVEFDPDPEPAGPGFRTRLAVLVSLLAVLGATVGLLVVMAGSEDAPDSSGEDNAEDDGDGEGAVAELELAGPFDGLESLGLPLTVEPDVGLGDGQVVTVSGSGYEPGSTVGVAQCWGPADGSGSVENCDIGNYQLAGTDEQGGFTMTMLVRRFIGTSTGEHDCADGGLTLSCSIAAGNIRNYDESGVARTFFDPEIAGVRAPTLEVEPDRGLADGTEITVTGRNFVPGETALLTQCVIGGDDSLPGCFSINPTGEIEIDDAGGFVVTTTARRFVQGGAGDLDCVSNPYGCRLAASAEKMPNPVALVFDGSQRPAPGPDYRVSPSSGLVDSDTVHVELSRFGGTDGNEFFAAQCVDVLAPEVACGPSLTGVVADEAIVFDLTVARIIETADGSVRDCADRGRTCYLRVETDGYTQERLPLEFELGVSE